MEAFLSDVDIHTATASRVFETDVSEVTTDMRRRAKTINFGLLYGMEAFGLSQRLDISREEAAGHIDAYFSQFPAVKSLWTGWCWRRGGRDTPPRFSSGAVICRAAERQFPDSADGGADGAQRSGTGNGGGHNQKGDDCSLFGTPEGERRMQSLVANPRRVGHRNAGRRPFGVAALTVEVMEGVADLVVPLKVDVASGRSPGGVQKLGNLRSAVNCAKMGDSPTAYHARLDKKSSTTTPT